MEQDLKDIILRAASRGGVVSFASTDLMNRTVPYRARLNRFLSQYGKLSDMDSSHMWSDFSLNDEGWKLAGRLGFTITPELDKKEREEKRMKELKEAADKAWDEIMSVATKFIELLKAIISVVVITVCLFSW